jgi:hypothetical protein
MADGPNIPVGGERDNHRAIRPDPRDHLASPIGGYKGYECCRSITDECASDRCDFAARRSCGVNDVNVACVL